MTKSILLASSALLMALGQTSTAWAQQPDVATDTVDEVVVTAERFGSGLTRATFTLGAQDIGERPLGADIMQSLVKVPGVQVSTGDARGGSFSFELYMRGLNKEQIGLTIDGVPTGDARFNGGSPPTRFIESSNIARIVASQSAADIGAPSRFALGGFIDFVTDHPTRDPGLTIEAGLGSFDFGRLYARADFGEFAPGLTGYASASQQENDVWAGRDSRSSERDHYEVKLRKQFDNGSVIQGRVAYNDQTDNDFNIVTKGEFEADPHGDQATDALTGVPAQDVNFGGALGGVRKDLLAYVNGRFVLSDKITLSLNPYYQTLDGESFRYQDRARRLTGTDPRAVTGYNANGGAIRPALITTRDSNAVGGPADMRVTPRDRERYGLTSELKVQDLIQGHTMRIGAWYEGGDSSESRNFYRITDPVSSIAYDRGQLNYVEYERTAEVETVMLYAQDEIRLFDERLKLALGVTWYDVRYDAKSPLEYRANLAFSQASDVNPKLGATWRLNPEWEVFGGYARNFSGIPEDAFLGSTAVIDPDDLAPIQTRNLDLGLRYVRPDRAFSIQAYDVELENGVGIVPRDPTASLDPDEIVRGNVATRAANTQGQTSRGVEATVFQDLGAIDLYAAYAYQDATHDDPAMGSEARKTLAALGVIGGARVRDIPRHSLFAQVGWSPTRAIRLELNARHVGERVGGHIIAPTTFQEVGVEMLDAYTVVGLTARYDLERAGLPATRLQLNVDNLFEETYLAAVSSSTATQPEFGLTSGPNVRTLDRYFVGAPRTVTVSLRTRF
ncbi:TonB-dependent receptor [uncultured Brevundimonas sp.]|uniref:TonB-dependent receptor n=1 Tax=uncultured Brevundimonas sp. TaxID=213418 RepID=UPI00260C718C|nr:TonB-dependent receptor [uncultured Brevundimonas sp.]